MPKRAAAYCRIKVAAKYCDVSERTIRRWMDCGLPYSKPDDSQQGVVLIKWADLDAWLNEHSVGR